MNVLLAAEAEADLERIGDHIAERNPTRATTFIQELRTCCLELGDMPKRFGEVERYRHLGLRRRVHGNYLVFYRLRDGSVEVLHVLHGAMDIDMVLSPNNRSSQ